MCRSHGEINIKINLDCSKAQAYKDESFIHQNPKKRKQKQKITYFFTQMFLAPLVNT
jgi:predicted SnoaL-like aldol condensation-catalyzing enzyme